MTVICIGEVNWYVIRIKDVIADYRWIHRNVDSIALRIDPIINDDISSDVRMTRTALMTIEEPDSMKTIRN